ncbi:methyl-accepting chemotaxis sensory transducer, partial [Candidatus Magnetobacterium bavaricum]
MRLANMKIKTQLILGYVLLLVAMVIVSSVVYRSLSHLLEISGWVDHTYKVMGEADKIVASLVDQETGVRGFLVTGIEEYLEPYNKGQETFKKTITELKKTVNDNPAQVSRLEKIEAMAGSLDKEFSTSAIELRREVIKGEKAGNKLTMNDIVTFMNKGTGKKYMDQLRVMIAEFRNAEAGLLDVRSKDAHDTAKMTSNVSIYGTLMAIIVGIIVVILITRSLISKLNAMVKAAESIANGDLSVSIENNSSDEIGILAVAFTEMIKKIKLLISDVDILVNAAVAGKLATRADATKHSGDYRKIVEGVNKTLDAVIGPLNVAANYVDRISKGDIPPTITETY